MRGTWRWVLLGYSCLIAYWMLFGFGRMPEDTVRFNLIPFHTVINSGSTFEVDPWGWLRDMGGNVLLFTPIGWMLPIVFRWRWSWLLLLFISWVTGLELLQFYSHRGMLDVDDLILNVLGFGIGYVIHTLVEKPQPSLGQE